MDYSHYGYSVSRALRRVFLFNAQLPLTTRPLLCLKSRALLHPTQTRNASYPSRPPGSAAGTLSSVPRRFGPKDQQRASRDEEIQPDTIRVVSDESGISAPQSLRRFLASMDRTQYFLVQVSPEGSEEMPVCRMMKREAVFKREREKAKPAKTAEQQTKEIELGWKMADGDLNHKMTKLEEFLQKGKKVEITIAPKRKREIITPQEAQDFLERVRARLDTIEGGPRETKPLQGELGKLVTLFVEATGAGRATSKAESEGSKRRKAGSVELRYSFNKGELDNARRKTTWLFSQGKNARLVVKMVKDPDQDEPTERGMRDALRTIEDTMKQIPGLREIGERKGKVGETIVIHFSNEPPAAESPAGSDTQ